MPPVKKIQTLPPITIFDKDTCFDAIRIYLIIQNGRTKYGVRTEVFQYKREFEDKHKCSYESVLSSIFFWRHQINKILPTSEKIEEKVYDIYCDCIKRKEIEPLKIDENKWIFKDSIYEVNGLYNDEQFRLLVFNEFDKERRRFERLKNKFDASTDDETNSYSRPRLSEQIRIEVWRRDGGKCARCGSREKLEYDHIIPISKGGSNTARNIELLCESCNRSKGAKIV